MIRVCICLSARLVLFVSLVVSLTFGYAAADSKTLAHNNTEFALALYQRLRSEKGNLLLSPYSISTALSMTFAGARGNTQKQMAKVMRFSLGQTKLHSAFAEQDSKLKTIQKHGNIELSVANSLWPQKEYKLLDSYLALVKKDYGVSITAVDYQKETEAARMAINGWVEDRTQNKIRDLLKPRHLNPDTRLVLVNALYFKGNWKRPFNKSFTNDLPFFVSSDRSVTASLMNQTEEFRYADLATLQILELPYAGDELSMLVFLPKKKFGIDHLEKRLTVKNLKKWRRRLQKQKVRVLLPKFKTGASSELRAPLVAMGMTDAFSVEKANFSGIVGKSDKLWIEDVLHKAFVEVSEEGTEAAAATVVLGASYGRPPRRPVFLADHPFVFFIQDNRTKTILFMGRIADPTDTGER